MQIIDHQLSVQFSMFISVTDKGNRSVLMNLPEELKYVEADTHIILLADNP